MPPVPVALVASSFKKDAPKCVDNLIQARAVGSVCGIYETDEHDLLALRSLLNDPGLPERIVPHANGMRKLEIGQINTLLLTAREVRGRGRMSATTKVERGKLTFSVEARLLRELGERLVRSPEVAIVELVKNAYDADASRCTLRHKSGSIVVADNGHGMTLDEFRTAWMRVGTSSKESSATSRRFSRDITGEKGIGRFAVRFLGTTLDLESIAYDGDRGEHTRLRARLRLA